MKKSVKETYVSPEVHYLDIYNEGILCSSIEDALEEDWEVLELGGTYEKLF